MSRSLRDLHGVGVDPARRFAQVRQRRRPAVDPEQPRRELLDPTPGVSAEIEQLALGDGAGVRAQVRVSIASRASALAAQCSPAVASRYEARSCCPPARGPMGRVWSRASIGMRACKTPGSAAMATASGALTLPLTLACGASTSMTSRRRRARAESPW
ncbi:hypothetical protein [Mesorhizobium sp. B2-4-17]|uniref:hypothetical protein n=1 Tax=Mesorhizobium sp. B2-4-17 TaxID=2589932 RepID=UPI001126A485|nr:hypothetical protein [Mesorhizobium sp. B2-4-17]TPK91480.1 hypothetical protein FJ548_04370 [Mesorhizobium sp. B2-4-17]